MPVISTLNLLPWKLKICIKYVVRDSRFQEFRSVFGARVRNTHFGILKLKVTLIYLNVLIRRKACIKRNAKTRI